MPSHDSNSTWAYFILFFFCFVQGVQKDFKKKFFQRREVETFLSRFKCQQQKENNKIGEEGGGY